MCMRRRELTAEIERLPADDRETIDQAVSKGRAVENQHHAFLAAQWAVERRQRTARFCFGILGPLCLLMWGLIDWLVERHDPNGSGLAVLLGGWLSIGTLTLMIWLLVWRPLLRAETANLVAGGTDAPRPTRIASDWLLAWLFALQITWLVGLVLHPLDVSLGPLGVIPWCLLTWAIKRAFDNRRTGVGNGAPHEGHRVH